VELVSTDVGDDSNTLVQGIALAEVDNIQNGLHTDILKRTGRAARADVYLSLLCPFRTLDLCFESVEERETWQELLEVGSRLI
jgi:hypothetical protein